MEFFETSLVEAMPPLKCLADDSAPPLMACPREEGRKLRDCHGPKFAELRPHLPPKQFETELREMIQLARAGGIRLPERKIMLKRMWKRRERQVAKEKQAEAVIGARREEFCESTPTAR